MRKGIYNIFVITALLLLVGCSKDSADDNNSAQESYAPLQMVGLSRAVEGDTEWDDIHVFLTNSTTLTEGKFKYDSSTEEWSTRLKLKSGSRTYRLYGFMPDDAELTSSLTSWSDNGAVLTLENLDPLTPKDYSIITGVRQVELATDKTSATRGNFSFVYKSNRNNYINLFLDHLLSQIEFNMKVGTTYSALRTIKVKKMTLKLANISRMAAEITLANGTGISNINFTTTGTAANSCVMLNEEKTLTTTGTVICCAFAAPVEGLLNNLVLETEFDVYDKEGKKIAERTATNKLTTPLADVERGEKRTLLITVDPSYLYVLSDADLDNPTIKIEN